MAEIKFTTIDWSYVYSIGLKITWPVTFILSYLFMAFYYGILGWALGWIPAIIIATIMAVLWPVSMIVYAGLVLFILAIIFP